MSRGSQVASAYGGAPLPLGVRSRRIDNGNGLSMHILEAGFERPDRPCALLLHGFPELAYSWRKVMPALAAAGFYVIAPDQRGYGRTTGWDGSYDGDVGSYRLLNLAKDILGLVFALGYQSIAAIVGHDYGSPVAAWCALLRPDVFHSVALLSAPFAGPPTLPFNTASVQTSCDPDGEPGAVNMQAALAALDPPRKHYQAYYSTREADSNMRNCPQGIHAFLRAYYHVKSANWKQNKPFPLKSWTAAELEKMPRYYIMDLDRGMAETVAQEAPTVAEAAACSWLGEDELRVYSAEFSRTGFQGGLQWYRHIEDPKSISELQLFSGRTIDVPSCFIAGTSDWGVYQSPGALEAMTSRVCTQFRGIRLVDDAGHWVQQEQAEVVATILAEFLENRA
jgi:pimeloyl-ACP methyl ester carboxylesterase